MTAERHRGVNLTPAGKVFDNIIFLAEAFSEKSDEDLPRVPMLELARSFELSRRPIARAGRRKSWALWE